jgi:(p)ppGpp synthase/HD superfamily hydrolase
MLMSEVLETALRWAAIRHRDQTRKGSGTPYFEHVVGVAMILDRLGFEEDVIEDVIVAALLHDVVEDTEATLDDVRENFGDSVASLVAHCSEVKLDPAGQKRPWEDRKRDHLAALAEAPTEARAIVLADKLHNLVSMVCDLRAGRPVWSLFNAEKARVLWYYEATFAALSDGSNDERITRLVAECRRVFDTVRTFPDPR